MSVPVIRARTSAVVTTPTWVIHASVCQVMRENIARQVGLAFALHINVLFIIRSRIVFTFSFCVCLNLEPMAVSTGLNVQFV